MKYKSKTRDKSVDKKERALERFPSNALLNIVVPPGLEPGTT